MQMTWAKKGPDLRLIYELTVTSIKQRYRKTWAGIFWVVVNPLLTYIVQAFVFKVVLKLQISNYLLFLLSGLIPWIFINQTFQMCTSIFTSQEQFIKSMTINPLYLYSAQVFDNFINMSISFAVLFIPIGYYMDTFQKGFMLPFLCFAPFVFVYSAGLILATVHVFYRDKIGRAHV